MKSKIKLIHIISNLSQGGAQVLLYDILINLKKKNEFDIKVITIDSGEYIKKFEEAGIKVIDLKKKGLLNLNILSDLKKILKELKPDIVHTHLNKADFYGRIAARQVGVRIIFSTCHNYSTHHNGAAINKRSFFDIIDNFVIKYSNCNLIAISNVVKQYLIYRNAEFGKITQVIYNGVNIEKENYLLNSEQQTKLRKEFNLEKNDFVITVIGRMDKQKGHLFFLESIKDYLRQNTDIKILIVGDGRLKNKISSFINSNFLENQVQILGFIIDIDPIIEISNLICVPSLWEGFGLVIIEGMIKNKIVLASNVGGIPEIIEDDKTGILFKSIDSKSLIEKLNYIYRNIDNLNEIKQNALDMVREKFDISKNSELYYKAYNIIK